MFDRILIILMLMSNVNGLNVTCNNRFGLHPFRRMNACYIKDIDRALADAEKLYFSQSYSSSDAIKILDIHTEADGVGIDHIPTEAFDWFPKLEILRVNSHVKIIRPQDLENGDNLMELAVSNQLEEIRRDLFTVNNRLVFLSFESNRIRAIDDFAFEHLQRLFGLKLQKNKLEEIKRNTFAGLSALHVLNLSWNRIRSIQDGAFDSLTQLQFLHLQDNQLEILTDGMFRGLINLMDISFSHNRIHHIYNSLQHLHNVKKIDLNYNQISDMDLNEYAKLPSLIDLRLISSGFRFKSHGNWMPATSSPSEYLYLDSNNFSNPLDLRELHVFGELNTLSLDNNLYDDFNLGDKKLINILPKLKFLSMEGTYIDESSLNRIAEQLKNDSITLH